MADRHPPPVTLSDSKFSIIWVGRLTEQKGVDDLVRLIELLNRHCGDEIEWMICGDGELKSPVIECEHRYVDYFIKGGRLKADVKNYLKSKIQKEHVFKSMVKLFEDVAGSKG